MTSSVVDFLEAVSPPGPSDDERKLGVPTASVRSLGPVSGTNSSRIDSNALEASQKNRLHCCQRADRMCPRRLPILLKIYQKDMQKSRNLKYKRNSALAEFLLIFKRSVRHTPEACIRKALFLDKQNSQPTQNAELPLKKDGITVPADEPALRPSVSKSAASSCR